MTYGGVLLARKRHSNGMLFQQHTGVEDRIKELKKIRSQIGPIQMVGERLV
jgi:hypothetical protein